MMTMHSLAAAMTDCGNNHHLQVAASSAAIALPTPVLAASSAAIALPTPVLAASSAAIALPTPVLAASSEFWTTDEVAAYLRCEPQTIRKNLSRTGAHHGLKPRRFGRRLYFKAADVRALLEA